VNTRCPEGGETVDAGIEVSRISTKYKNLDAFHITVERDAQENKKGPMKNLDNSI
jgi:hypothetical protein